MNVQMPAPGAYVVAVSGGVDSMVLLHMLQGRPELKLTVAHFDHGIRPDSAEDRQLVAQTAKRYGLDFIYDSARLGPGASEAAAREARYAFLHQVRSKTQAQAIVTAHHNDDVLETAILNLLRGTGRKGLTSLGQQNNLLRPLLNVPKTEIINYARTQNLEWHEDSTNQDIKYARNYVRQRILPRLSDQDRIHLRTIIEQARGINNQLDAALTELLKTQKNLNRQWFASLPHDVAREVMAAWLREQGVRDFDRKTLERLVVAAKVSGQDRQINVQKGRSIMVQAEHLALTPQER